VNGVVEMHIALAQFYTSPPTPAYDEIASALRAWGHTVWVGTRDGDGHLAWDDGERVVAVQRGPAPLPELARRIPIAGPVLRRIMFFAFMLRVRGFLRQARPDIVQINRTLGAWLLPLRMPSQMSFILDIRQAGEKVDGGLIGKSRDWRAARTWRVWSRFFYDRACFLHPAAARRVLGRGWSRWGSVVPLGLDDRFLAPSPNSVGLGRPNRRVRFIYAGTIHRVRMLERVLFAVHRILLETTEFQVVFLGPDKAEGFYQGLLSELKVNSVVAILPPVPYQDVPAVMSEYDVALAYIPSVPQWQYQPTLKVMEYRALGMPIIATDIEPNRELVQDGVNGVLVQDSVESLAEGMLRFLEDHDFLLSCRQNARAMRSGVTWNEVAKMYEQDVYLPCQARNNLERCDRQG
jgi:glycosyltransferase involved in cell wall biosynthesis